MHIYRRQLFIASVATLVLAFIMIISSLVSFVPLLIIFVILLVAISTMTDGLALFLLFRQQEGIIQFIRGIILLFLFLIIFINFILNRF